MEGCKRSLGSLDKSEGQLKLPAKRVCRGFLMTKDKILLFIRDDDKKKWFVSDGIRCRKHNRVWHPPIPRKEENEVVEGEAKDLEEWKRSLEERERQVQLRFRELSRSISVSIREEKARLREEKARLI